MSWAAQYVMLRELLTLHLCKGSHISIYGNICLPVFLSFVSAPYTIAWRFGYSHLSTVRKPAEVSLDML